MSTQEHKHEPLVVNAQELANILKVSRRHIVDLNREGKLPEPIKLGAAIRWSVPEISAWVAAGAPDRETWNRSRISQGVSC